MEHMSFSLPDAHVCFQFILLQSTISCNRSVMKIMQKDTATLLRAWRLGATSGADFFIKSTAWHSFGSGRDPILLFCFSWLATLLPLMPHQVLTLWLWGALSGVCLVTTSWLLFHLNKRRSASWSLLGCGALISIASLFDFWRIPPVYLSSWCHTSMAVGFPAEIFRHVELHFRWFPVTNMAMLLWICLSFHASSEPRMVAIFSSTGTGAWASMRCCVRTQILPRLVYCILMLFCMGAAMSVFESLGVGVQKNLSADGFVCAMLCGMALYHVVLSLYLHFSAKVISYFF